MKLFAHQERNVQFLLENHCVCNFGEPGTGKTITYLAYLKRDPDFKRALILCTKSIMQAAWGNDIEKFCPDMTYALATAENRKTAFDSNADIVIMNHDGVAWLKKNLRYCNQFSHLGIDESTAFKNPQAKRSKAVRDIARRIEKRVIMTGTPAPNGILDIWHQVFLVDQGERLNRAFSQFRNATTVRVQVAANPNAVRWDEKPGAKDAVFNRIHDIVLRDTLTDCIDMPPHNIHTLEINLSPTHLRQYLELQHNMFLDLDDNELTAFNAATLWGKLFQFASGGVYTDDGTYLKADDSRFQLILDLVEERPASLVAFNWHHQRDQLVAAARKRGIRFAVIDGTTKDRNEVVNAFQNGELQTIFLHPATAAHGLTLTRGRATIWTSPTTNLEHYEQLNRRIYRAGQKEKTETINIAATGTVEPLVYERLSNKEFNQTELLRRLHEHWREDRQAA